jgi:YidC/Oxa1 family membrane protein insertase
MPVVIANPLQPLIDVCDTVLVWLHDNVVGGSWGLAIIALTVVVRLLLLPLTLKQFRSMQALQRLQPQMKELQAKYKDDRQRLNQEMMKFYQEHKVNPFASCLPLVAQMPVFLALFYTLRQDLKVDICPKVIGAAKEMGKPIANISCDQINPGSAHFLFINDLTANATGAVLVVLIVLYVGSQLAASLLMSVSADKNQRRLVVLMPLFFVVFIIRFPTGLILYWITTNFWTILQQYIVKRTVGPIRPPAATAGAAAAKPGGTSGGASGGSASAGGRKPKAPSGDSGGDGAGKAEASPPPPPRKRSRKRSGRRR